MTTFLGLCLDANDPRLVAPFWSAALGLSVERLDDEGGVLRGSEPSQSLWINRVPEPKTVKDRVHLDLHTTSIESLVDLGATIRPEQDDADRWTVLLDPEGHELCGFVREPDKVPAYPLYEIVVDCADADAIGDWWAGVLGVELQGRGEPWRWLENVPGVPFEAWVFGPVPEPKTVKNRLHWDLAGDVADLEARGATVLDRQPRWTVMADPEGNEFCVFPES